MRAVQEPVRGEVNDAIPVQPGGKHSLHTGVKIQGAEATAGRNESQDSSGFLSRIKQPRKTRQAIRKQCLLLRWGRFGARGQGVWRIPISWRRPLRGGRRDRRRGRRL